MARAASSASSAPASARLLERLVDGDADVKAVLFTPSLCHGTWTCTMSGTISADVDVAGCGVLPGSFNPLHQGHEAMADAASLKLGGLKVLYELSVRLSCSLRLQLQAGLHCYLYYFSIRRGIHSISVLRCKSIHGSSNYAG